MLDNLVLAAIKPLILHNGIGRPPRLHFHLRGQINQYQVPPFECLDCAGAWEDFASAASDRQSGQLLVSVCLLVENKNLYS